ncbi:hypothetical protein AB0N46_07910 [Streptomyces albidoflavus]|uniref:hypothetical protein n=1 Tax=Streptomyces albidoflavus TaxID=1886 RepID=UPI00343EAB3E
MGLTSPLPRDVRARGIPGHGLARPAGQETTGSQRSQPSPVPWGGRLADRSGDGDLAHAAFRAVHVLCGAVTWKAYARSAP